MSVDLASFELVRGLRADVLRFLARVDLVFCNEDEAAVLVGAEDAVGAQEGAPDEVRSRCRQREPNRARERESGLEHLRVLGAGAGAGNWSGARRLSDASRRNAPPA